MLLFKDAGCRVSGSDVELIIIRPVTSLWPISGQQPVYVTQTYQISSLGTSTEVRQKKYQVPHFGDRNLWKRGIRVPLKYR